MLFLNKEFDSAFLTLRSYTFWFYGVSACENATSSGHDLKIVNKGQYCIF